MWLYCALPTVALCITQSGHFCPLINFYHWVMHDPRNLSTTSNIDSFKSCFIIIYVIIIYVSLYLWKMTNKKTVCPGILKISTWKKVLWKSNYTFWFKNVWDFWQMDNYYPEETSHCSVLQCPTKKIVMPSLIAYNSFSMIAMWYITEFFLIAHML